MIEIIKEHPKRTFVVVGTILFILAIVIILNLLNANLIYQITSEKSQEIFIFGISLNNIYSSIAIIAIVIGAIWGVIQYNKNIKLRQQEKAVEIAKSFSGPLSLKSAIIKIVIEHSEVYKLLKIDEKDYDAFKIFNSNEIRTIYEDDYIFEKYNKEFNNSNIDQIYYRVLDSLTSFNSFTYLTTNNKTYTEKEAKTLLKNKEFEGFPFHFSLLISNVLNEFEYLCMNLSSQAAGSKYVYQSLHQIFLRTVRLLCIHIAKSNSIFYSDKYYTNLIHVYNEWTSLYFQDKEKENKLKNKANKILNPKIKTV